MWVAYPLTAQAAVVDWPQPRPAAVTCASSCLHAHVPTPSVPPCAACGAVLCCALLLQMAPEALLHGKVSKAGDVYAFGITLWELFTGGQAYQGAVQCTGDGAQEAAQAQRGCVCLFCGLRSCTCPQGALGMARDLALAGL